MKIFVLAHPDDEVFFLPHIFNSSQKLFMYLTNGVSETATLAQLNRRSLEAKSIFQNLIANSNSEVVWWGLENSISDGKLHTHVNVELIEEIHKVVMQQGVQVTQILTTTFEGAHQDHDSAAVIARGLAAKFQVEIIEMSTYPQLLKKMYSFKVLRPKSFKKTFKFNRLKILKVAIRLMIRYRTQWLTWLGLGVSILSVYAFRKYRSSEPIQIQTVNPCFYEFRGRANQADVLRNLLGIDI